MKKRHFALFALAWPGLLLLSTPSGALAQMPTAQGEIAVGVMTVQSEAVPLIFTLPGRAVAQNMVSIRPRVDGFVTEILYTPGQPITVGTPMFKIDPTTYEAEVDEARANLASAKAAVPKAQAAYDRSQKLQNSGSTRAELEEYQAALEQAVAAEKAAEAALRVAETQLSWTTVASPLDGMPSVAAVSPGDLVTSGQSDAMATVTQLDPIDVDMYEPSARMQRVRNRVEAGEIKASDSLNATLTLENGVSYAAKGEMVAPGYSVSTSTGTIDFRFRFQNPEYRVLPGMFVRGQLEVGQIQAILVPQLAATRGRDGVLTAWVALDGKAVKRSLTDEGVHDNRWIVTAGLKDGEQLIVNGTTNLIDGAKITATPVQLDKNGVVQDEAATADPIAETE